MSAHFRTVLGAALLLLMCSCTRVIVKKDPGSHDRGFRFNRPKPYLFIGPADAEAKKSDSGSSAKGGGTGSGSEEGEEQEQIKVEGQIKISGNMNAKQPAPDNLFTKVVIEIKYLPDYNEEYSVKLTPGIGQGKLEFKLDDGWNLTSVGIQTDQRLPELISSIASLVSAVKPGGKAGGAPTPSSTAKTQSEDKSKYLVDTRRDVPLGFYEPVIVVDEHGCKKMFGWRYVGFLPFTGCPVTPCIRSTPVDCDPTQLWGLIVADGSLKFDTLDNISRGVTHKNERGREYGRAVDADSGKPLLRPVNPEPTELPQPRSLPK